MSRTKTTLLLALALLAAPSFASQALAKKGADDGPGHDVGDDKGGKGGDDNGGDDNGGDDNGGDDNGGDDNGGDDDDSDDDNGGDDNGGGKGGGGGSWERMRSDLMRHPTSPDADTRGHVEVRRRSGRQRLSVEAEMLDVSVNVEFLVADAGGTLVSVGMLTTDAVGEAELELDTGDGASLPFGAGTVAELAGRMVEVRDAVGAVLLTGTVPSFGGTGGGGGGSSVVKGRETVKSDDGDVRVRFDLRSDARKGREKFRIDVKGLPSGVEAELWIADATGTLVMAGVLSTNGGGNARWRGDSRRGDSLPLGVSNLRDLSGRAFELRVDGVGVTAGALPLF